MKCSKVASPLGDFGWNPQRRRSAALIRSIAHGENVPDITWTDDFFPILLRHFLIPTDVKSVVDVGCGRGLVGALLRIYRDPEYTVAVDTFKPYLNFVRDLGMYDEVIEHDVSTGHLPFGCKRFDVAICLEVIEHLKKDDGFRLLEELQRIAGRVIISTPGAFFPQKHFDGNPKQAHISSYRVRELEDIGFKVYRVGNLLLFGKQIPVRANALYHLFPRLSGTILAVRDR